MSTTRITVAILCLALCLSLTWMLIPFLHPGRLHNWLTLEQINERATADLTNGMSFSEIDKYFTASGVEHGYYEKNNQILAIIRNIKGGQLLVSKGAQIAITLDQTKKLERIEVRPTFTGP